MTFCEKALAALISYKYFDLVMLFLGSLVGKIFLTVSLWALIYHTLTGVRHLIWDLGIGVNIKWVDLSSWFIILVSFGASGIIILGSAY